MKSRKGRTGYLALAMAVLCICMLPVGAQANDKYWVGANGVWNASADWSTTPGGAGGAGQPVNGDNVYLTQSDSSNRTVTYVNTAHPNAVLNSLTIDATGSGTMTLSQGAYNLSAGDGEYIAITGTGHFNQTGGNNTVTGGLYLGYNTGSSGFYNFSGTGSLQADNEYIGYNGAGTFTQTGGTNTVTGTTFNALYLGYNTGSSGTYNLSGTATLQADNEYIGWGGTGKFTQTGGTNTLSGDISLGGGGNGTYNLSGTGTLQAVGETIGGGSTGTFTQSGGTNTVGIDGFYIGYWSGNNGTYALSGGSLQSSNEMIGYGGTGQFTQTGGTNTGSILLGCNFSGNYGKGTYNLSGTGTLQASNEDIGYGGGTGTFTQTGGTNAIANGLYLGLYYVAGGEGTYNLSGTGTLQASNEYIGYSNGGTGTFTQTGGTNTVSGTLFVADASGSTGAYTLSGGTLTAGTIDLNAGGTLTLNGGTLNAAAFNQTGGTVNGTLQNNGAFAYNSGLFNGRLVNNGTVAFNADFTAADGMENDTSLTIPAGRTITLNGAGLDNEGTIALAGGALTGNGPFVNNGSMSGYGTIGGAGGFVNNGALTQSGGAIVLSNSGTNVNFGNMDLAPADQLRLMGAALTNAGSLDLNGGGVAGTGTLINTYGGTISGSGMISSIFNNDGGVLLVQSGTTNITKDFNNSGLIQMAGYTANLAGGTINNTGSINGNGNIGNNITNTGTIEAIGGTLTLGGTVNNTGGLMTASTGSKLLVAQGMATNAGIINLTGGTFDNNSKTLANSGQISGYGVFNTGGLSNTGTVNLTGTSGSTTTVNGSVTNQNGGSMRIAYNPAIFTGNVTNYGTVKLTNTNVTFAGTYTEHGTYISDPGTTYLTNAIIDATGAWQGGAGDTWSISGDFQNNSTQNTTWNTKLSTIALTGATNHLFSLAGIDKGASLAGYTDNFAWGTLSLAGGGSITLNTAGASGHAQYVTTILGLDIGSGEVTNVSESAGSGLNIYYLASAAGNTYLDDKTYNLEGGGELIPINNPVPIPGAMWLLGSGLAGLISLRRRTERK